MQHPFLQIRSDLQVARPARPSCRSSSSAREDVERYLAIEFPEHRFPPELAGLVHARTEGNPLFMADLFRYLRDRHVIALRGRPLDADAVGRARSSASCRNRCAA